MGSNQSDRQEWFRKAARTYGAVFQFPITVAALAFLGYYLDQRWRTLPWLTLAGTLIGFIAGLINLFKGIEQERKKSPDEKDGNRETPKNGPDTPL